ncbi:diacylglycerol/lipid kinase family protein [Catelliglobosispora koreensis]|uniref:diacylglycerol/lipid kinase family protein n=1 Tax=Catelliglobosispora koreensis TaxID=129052 RepID=UPI00037D206F|nr:diacylglycerol kinase family protein [Catelliglobosispora koreensis]
MRGLLVVNPKATTTSARTRDVLVGALRSTMDLTVSFTRRRGHGHALALEAAKDGIDVVVALGGDGTINEVVNGLMGVPVEQRPKLGVVPGGSTNVFVRALGLPRHPVEATGVILDCLRDNRSREIGLGRADDRYFTFCAGIGIDAAVTRRVERARHKGRRASPMLYARSFFREYAFEAFNRTPALTLAPAGEEPLSGLATIIVQNTAPWTYVGDRPIQASPEASFDEGLDVLALKAMRPPGTIQTVTKMLSKQTDGYGKQVVLRHDLSEFVVSSTTPQAFQLDGDYLGDREKVKFSSVPAALRVIC